MNDNVTSPPHYNQGAIECIDAIWESGNGRGYCIGNAIKYLWRAGLKGEEVEDIEKAAFYLRYLLSKLSSEHTDPREAVKTAVPEWSPLCEKGRVWIYVKAGTDVSAFTEGYLLEVQHFNKALWRQSLRVLSLPGGEYPDRVALDARDRLGLLGVEPGWDYGNINRVIRRL